MEKIYAPQKQQKTASPEKKPLESQGPSMAALRTGAGEDAGALLRAAAIPETVYTLPAGETAEDALRLSFSFDNGAAADVGLVLGRGSDLIAVMDYTSAEAGFGAIRTRIVLGDGARLRLVQIQRAGQGFTLLNDIGADCGAFARLELIRLVLGGESTFDGCSVALRGDKSAFVTEIGYTVGGDGRLDMNYEAIHTGKKTECDIRAAGVLSERAFKLFRGTIDLRNGCSGSVGNEIEDVLLMDETVHNQTIPVILCAEEDVVGNHGATIGRLDENLIFYLESRGLEREQIYAMMARARIDAVIRRIPDRKTVEALFPALAEGEAQA